MKASIARRWFQAEKIVLSSVYGPQHAESVLSRPARKPVASAPVRSNTAGIPIPARRAA